MPRRQRHARCAANFDRVPILPATPVLCPSNYGDASATGKDDFKDAAALHGRRIIRTVGCFDVSGVAPGARDANSFLHQAARTRTFNSERLYAVFPAAAHAARAAIHAAYATQQNEGAHSRSHLYPPPPVAFGSNLLEADYQDPVLGNEQPIDGFTSLEHYPEHTLWQSAASESIVDLASKVTVAALLLPAPLFSFLAKVDAEELDCAVASILWDAAPGEFPASRAPCPPTRHSHTLDNVLLKLAGRTPASDFWQIPVQAVFLEPVLPRDIVHTDRTC